MSRATDRSAPDEARASGLRHLEVVATILLMLATVATAWSGFQATRWGQETTRAQTAAHSARILAARADGLANTQTQIDVATFSSWVDAYARGEDLLADFYFARLRAEFKPAVDAWVAATPLKNPDAPLTPFEMPQYVLAARQEADRQDEVTETKSAEVRRNLQRQSNYVLAVVLFATALFFAGASTRIAALRLRLAVIAVGCGVLLCTVIWIATFPVSVTL